MNNFRSPWFDFPIPSETITEAELSQLLHENNIIRYTRLLLIKRLRELGNYYRLLPPFEGRFNNTELKTIADYNYDLTNPNFYMQYGEPVIDSTLLSGVQTAGVFNLPTTALPTIRFKVSRLAGNLNSFSLLLNEDNKLQLAYWAFKTKIFDSPTIKVSDIFVSLFRENNQNSRKILELLDQSSDMSVDIELIDEIRKSNMLKSEEEFVDYIVKDRLGFFSGIAGISSQTLINKIASQAYATNNRRAFIHSNVPDFIRSIFIKDYVNYRFEIVSINSEDYIEIEWRFPQTEYCSYLTGMESWTSNDLLKLYSKR